MFVPPYFEESDPEAIQAILRAYPLATIVTQSSGSLNANHIPLHWTASPSPLGTLRGHVARANPILGDLIEEKESLAVFHGPNAYISPQWYSTKFDSGNVVPTWNYVVVHAYGILRAVDDPIWIRELVESLTDQQESAFPHPWKVSDASESYLESMVRHIVGIEMRITRWISKSKMSQNQPARNQQSVIAALQQSHDPNHQTIADYVRKKSKGASETESST